MFFIRRSPALIALLLVSMNSFAQSWTVQVIHPAGYTESAIWEGPAANEGPYFGGSVNTAPTVRGAAVFDTNGLLAILYSLSSTEPVIVGTDGKDFAGWGRVGNNRHAMFWKSDGPGIWNPVDLHVAGFSATQANDTFAGNVVGYTWQAPYGITRATLWKNGSQYVDLHPAGHNYSRVFGNDAKFQVGDADGHAAFWKGTSRSFRDVHPSGYQWSTFWKVDGAMGYGFTGGPDHAMVWNLKNGRTTDLHPPGVLGYSMAYAGHAELGWVAGHINDRATIWSMNGTYTDLHSLLPFGTYEASEANSIWYDGTALRVSGVAYISRWNPTVAVMWTLQ